MKRLAPNERMMSRAMYALLAVLAVAYAVQIASPLRLNMDGIKYLMMAESITQAPLFADHIRGITSPWGFPRLIATLDHFGLARALGIATFQLLFLLGTTLLCRPLLKRWLGLSPVATLAVLCLTLLSFATAKHSVLPLADPQYNCLSLLALLLLVSGKDGSRRRRWMFLIAGAIAALAATYMRSIGIALLPAVLWEMVGGQAGFASLPRWLRSKTTLAIVFIVGLIAAATIAGPNYLKRGLATYASAGVINSAAMSVWHRMTGLGSIFANVPSPNLFVDCFLVPFGIFILIVAGSNLWSRRKQLSGVDIYLLGFTAIMILWPYEGDPRLWLPTFPLMVGMGFLAARPWLARPAIRFAAVAGVLGFAALGVIAIVYTTRITFAGETFPERYGSGSFKSTYRMAYGSEKPIDLSQVDPIAIELVRHFDPDRVRPPLGDAR